MFNSMYEMLLAFARNRRLIMWTTIGFTAFGLAMSLAIPKKYKATATLMPPVSQGASLMSLMSRTSLMSDPEIGGTGFMPGMITPSDVFAYMLRSGTVASIVIGECGLVNHYKQDRAFAKRQDKAMDNVAKRLKRATVINVTDERFITITVEDKSKTKAADIANAYGEALDRVYAKMTMTQGGKMREFIEKRLLQEESLLQQTEDSLKQFQQRYKTISLPDEMKALVEMTATLEAKIIGQKIELDALKSYATDDNTQVKVLENQIAKSQQELNTLVAGGRGKTLFVSFAKAPEIGIMLGQLTRDVRIHQELYALLMQQLEQAKILEAKDTPKVQFLERAAPPYRKSWPKRLPIVALSAFVGIFVGIIVAAYSFWWQRFSDDERHRTLVRRFVEELRGTR
ncbi:MAG: Wzz/FepE/Etk N-terminal domain-containing protein [Candidatus Edwardsbacteria bacterium]|jgi:uncharacterized protein involved in exopolysaccharide biosynthesis|nr:Wzz/FepE/Etk N-terminal domain-containing protein [Candidatus Edwardsbacteria bacterium]